MNPKVDFYFAPNKPWHDELVYLRRLVLSCGLQEELKWGVPCYLADGTNIVLLHVFKDYCAILFFKGVLLKDPYGMLIQQTENVQVARQVRFTSLAEAVERSEGVKAYIFEAIEVEKSGATVKLKTPAEMKMAEEFQERLEMDAELKAAFAALTPGRQRAYLLHFSQPKQAKTREARIDKCVPFIMNGKGLDAMG